MRTVPTLLFVFACTAGLSGQIIQVNYTATLATVGGGAFGLGSGDQGRTLSGYFLYDASTPDTNSSPGTGDFQQSLSGPGFTGVLAGGTPLSFTGSLMPTIEIVNTATGGGDSFRFQDGPGLISFKTRYMSVNGTPDQKTTLYFYIASSFQSVIASDALPATFPWRANDSINFPHTFDLADGKGGNLLFQLTTVSTSRVTSALQFTPVAPCRIMDTRMAPGALGGPILAAGTMRTVPVTQSTCNIPNTALAYSLNATVVPSGTLGYLSIWPAGQTQPVVSTLNSLDGRVVANAAIVPAGSNGAINLYASDATNVILDINGYFSPASTPNSLSFYSLPPCRIADTRNAGGPLGGPFMGGGSSRSFPITMSPCGAPNTSEAYSLNITVAPHRPLSYLTSWPSGQTQPLVSTLNSVDGSVVANAAIVPAGTSGAISIFVTDDTDVIIDINGYFAPPGSPAAQSLYTVTPCRVADTRGGASLAGGGSRSFSIPTSPCSGIPNTAQAYSLNVTVVPNGALSYLTAWPTGQTQPVVSTLNSPAGKIVANAAIVPAGSNGAINVFVTNPTDLILDINAYFAP